MFFILLMRFLKYVRIYTVVRFDNKYKPKDEDFTDVLVKYIVDMKSASDNGKFLNQIVT